MSGTGARTWLCNRSKISLQPETREILGYRFRCNQEKRRIVFDHVGKEPCNGPVIIYHGVGQAYLFWRKGVGQKRISRWLGVGHCVFCKESHSLQIAWTGPATERIPRPIPDQSALPEFKYLSVLTSSNNDENGKKRIPNDWKPRSNIKKLFE